MTSLVRISSLIPVTHYFLLLSTWEDDALDQVDATTGLRDLAGMISQSQRKEHRCDYPECLKVPTYIIRHTDIHSMYIPNYTYLLTFVQLHCVSSIMYLCISLSVKENIRLGRATKKFNF